MHVKHATFKFHTPHVQSRERTSAVLCVVYERNELKQTVSIKRHYVRSHSIKQPLGRVERIDNPRLASP